MGDICETIAADNDQVLAVIKTNCFLTIAISLGLRIDIRDLYPPNNECVISLPFSLHLLIEW